MVTASSHLHYCSTCQRPLVSDGAGGTFEARREGRPSIVFHGLPAFHCEQCDAHYLSEHAESLARAATHSLGAEIEKSTRRASLDPSLALQWKRLEEGTVKVTFGTARVDAREAPSPVERHDWSTLAEADLVLTSAVDEAIRDFVGQIVDTARLADLLGPTLGSETRRHFLGLHGPPGCGKTTIAAEVARRLKKPLFVVRASELESSKVGESEKNIDGVFATVRAADGCSSSTRRTRSSTSASTARSLTRST